MIEPSSMQALDLYALYKKGHLAVSGGALEQPHKYLEMMKTIQRQIDSAE